ncbi:Serine/threonine-protein kinase pkn5 [Aquisphaera giovannonii]|uniref:Serine/threonine-protein kinase pkn5 n=1 Tax=Aquisphaera giovannonii TaxID=406548 RepID=A0A5B9W180_9BACT|nr:serine/threonine-protein kinase [Aquisphaera giovannonii]QEH33755.1 Serine/threonine-protein kinase pkn5 [Aquisphaera giovannonii]
MHQSDGSSWSALGLAPEFQRLWEDSSTLPDVFGFLASHPAAAMDEKVDVLRIDQEYRWRRGKPLPLQTYLRRLPNIAGRLDLVRRLIAGDQSCRRESIASSPFAPAEADVAGSSESSTQVAETPGALLETVVELPGAGDEKARDASPSAPTGSRAAGSTQAGTVPPSDVDCLEFHVEPGPGTLADPPRFRPVLESTRFTPIRRLGAGGMGVVFEAYDEERGELVAIKTMKRVDPAGLERFKGEFRSLSDITHPNLVQLFQLFSVDDCWFLTMELVIGSDLLTYVRGGPAAPYDDATRLSAPPDPTHVRSPAAGGAGEGADAPPAFPTEPATGCWSSLPRRDEAHVPPSPPPLDQGRLRSALLQLAEGLQHLHRAKKLHRDIKPTNVLVTEEGRVVILDFGLTADLEPGFLKATPVRDRQVVGTLAHMSPEQSLGLSMTAASDWYSVGVVLYQALTGRLPFRGTFDEVVIRKQTARPTPPDEIVPGVPADLASLCMDLLERDPERRPTGAQVLQRLGSGRGESPAPADLEARREIALIGREWHRDVLQASYEALTQGRTATVFVYGSSGTGKTALVRAFLDELAAKGDVVILAGRCYEEEWVPFKAVDNLIDALARHLKTLPRNVLDGILPADAWLLARVFPVLRGVDGVLQARRATSEMPDPQEMRLLVFAALRKLLQRLGRICRLVLAVDDLQWGDTDSAVLISDFLDGPQPPAMLFIGCFRQEEMAQSRLLQIIRHGRGADDRPGTWHRDLYVQPLTQVDSRSLALALLGREDPASLALAHLAARESGGNPLFIEELIKHLQTSGPGRDWASPTTVDLETVLLSRIREQPPEARRLLQVIAVSGRPIREALAFRAAGLELGGRAALGALRSARLIRGVGPSGQDQVETYHDRIRETVLAHLSEEELRRNHERMAEVLEVAGQADPEVLAGHLHGAGHGDRASILFVQAAEKAMAALAFNHAVRLYRLALDTGASAGPDVRRIRRRLGDALASGGRGAEAAAAYLQASEGAAAAENLELTRLASTQLLISGHVDEGLSLLRTILGPLGLSMPRTPGRALLSLLRHRAILRVRGLHFRPRDATQVSAEDLTRIDLCWSAVAGLSVIDPILGADFQTRGLLLALRAGERFRVARALAMEAAHHSTAGLGSARHAAALVERAGNLAAHLDHPEAQGVLSMVRGISRMMVGDWPRAVSWFEEAEDLFRNRCAGVTWERNTVRCLVLWSMMQTGRMAELRRRWEVLIKEAEERGDLYAATTLTTFFLAMIRLAEDRPGDVHEDLERAMGRWRHQGFFVQHSTEFCSRVHLDFYRGEASRAWERTNAIWPEYTRSMLFRIQITRIQMHELRGRAALAMAESAPDPARFLSQAADDARRLEREGQGWALAHAGFLRAGLAAGREDVATAVHLLEQAAARYDQVDMPLNAAVMRHRMGEVLGGMEGKRLVVSAEQKMREQSIASPEGWARMIAPGFSKIAASRVETSV